VTFRSDAQERAGILMDRLAELGQISDDPDRLTRLFLSPAHRRSIERVRTWMEQAGMQANMDSCGNLAGRYESDPPGAPALMLGSHIDSVRDAGRYDGPLGVLAAIDVVAQLNSAGRRMPFSLEVMAFGDEEGVRFHSSLLGSRAVAGEVSTDDLGRRDENGVTLAEALVSFGLQPDAIPTASRVASPPLAYLELHIEQGPVLEHEDKALGGVSAIAGSTRMVCTLAGQAGHAGALTMPHRRDSLTGAAECILTLEQIATDHGVVGTCGFIDNAPNAGNVVPGETRFSIDIRDQSDALREAVVASILDGFAEIAARRKLTLSLSPSNGSAAIPCHPEMIGMIQAALEGESRLDGPIASGAGHDGISMSRLCPIGMIFVRCAGGISHNPAESITIDDAAASLRVLDRFVGAFEPEKLKAPQ